VSSSHSFPVGRPHGGSADRDRLSGEGRTVHAPGRRLIRAVARVATFSGVNPNSSRLCSPGADAPKWSMQTVASEYRSQPKELAASTANRGTPEGRTWSRYSPGWRAK